MPIFEMKSISQSYSLEDVSADYRAAKRIGQYRVGEKAIYFPGFPGTRYLPYAAASRALTRNASMPLTGCCGKALAMVRYRIYYDGEFYQDFMFEKLNQANEAIDILAAARPEIPMERETKLAEAF